MGGAATPEPAGGGVAGWRAAISGMCASLVGIGLARFAYTPLIPPLITAGWFAPAAAAYLGAANLAGYLAGALLGRRLVAHVPPAAVLRGMMVLATTAFFACAFPLSFLWFFLWRFAAGAAGGTLMVLAAPTVLPHVPPERRGLAGGAIFTGVGLGIAASGTLVPLLLKLGLAETWLGLGALALLLTALAWGGWPAGPALARSRHTGRHVRRRATVPRVRAIYAEYCLNAVGQVPHMVFLVDFVARDLGQGMEAGAGYWVLFGAGAVLGPLVTGYAADRIGFARALRLALLVQVVGVALPVLGSGAVWLAPSSFIIGALVPGVVPLVLGRVQELVPRDLPTQQAAWSFATTAFALGQAGGAYGFSFVFAHTGGYLPLFVLGAASLALALAIDLGMLLLVRAPRE